MGEGVANWWASVWGLLSCRRDGNHVPVCISFIFIAFVWDTGPQSHVANISLIGDPGVGEAERCV